MNETLSAIRFEHHEENVPAELKVGERWVLCDEEKVPLIATASGAVYAASSTDPSTWRGYESALSACRENEWSFAGIGRVIMESEPFVGVDLDHCLDPETGELSPWSARILERLDSYSEISPSGTGVKIWVKAPSITRAHVKPGLEVYPRGRYFTVTGVTLRGDGALAGGAAGEIPERDDVLAQIIEEEFPKIDRDRRPYNGPKKVLDLLAYLEKANLEIFAELSDGAAERKYALRCPWLDEHTNADETGTYAGQYADGPTFFHCWHSHCASRRWQEFKAYADSIIYRGRPRRLTGRLR
jgi:primase-polymerase (primpol)-like protein